jgi:hypothetical protein
LKRQTKEGDYIVGELDMTKYRILNRTERNGFIVETIQKILPDDEQKRLNYISLKKTIEAKNKPN